MGCAWGKWQNELRRRAEEVDTSEPSLRHLGQLPVVLSGLRLASYLDSPGFSAAQGCNGDSRAKRTGEPCH